MKWSNTDWNALRTPPATTPDADDQARARYLFSKRSKAPNSWISDHLSESQRIRGAVYLAARVLGDAASLSQVSVWQRSEDATADTAESDSRRPLPWDHPLAELIRHPNRSESFGMLLRRAVQQMATTGTSLTWRIDNDYHPVELWSIPTASYQPVAVSARYPQGGYRLQQWFPSPFSIIPGTVPSGGVIVPAEQMIAIRLPHPLVDGEGFSPMTACGTQLDTMDGIDYSRTRRVQKGARIAATVSLDPSVNNPSGPEADRALQVIEAAIMGTDRDGDVALLPAGAKLDIHDLSGIEIGWLQSWDQLLSFTLAIFGVGKSIANLAEDVTFAQLYAALKQFSLLTMAPLLQLIADCYSIQLVHPFWGADYGLSLEPRKITDEENQDRVYKRRSSTGSWTVNETRVFEGLEPTKEAWGEERAFTGRTSIKEDERSLNDGKPTDLERDRPRNEAGRGSAGPREILAGLMRGGNGNGSN